MKALSVAPLCAALAAIGAAPSVHAAPGDALGAHTLSEAALRQAVDRGELPGRDGPPPTSQAQDRPQPASGPDAPSSKPVMADASGKPSNDALPPYKGYGAAALEILGFQLALNRFDNAFLGDDYHVTIGTIKHNLHSGWVVDQDPFKVNQLGHPYQGSVYFNAARSNGLNFWESMGYAFAGSAVWEIAGERTPPSRNDQMTTSFGGSFLGEALYRMANLVLEDGYGMDAGARELAAGVISPTLFFNRYVRPGKGSGLFASHRPAFYSRLQLGASEATHTEGGPSTSSSRAEAGADFLLDYGLPGKPGYTYDRPFDYFRFQLRASTVQGVESLSSRGLLLGDPYGYSNVLRGVWGLYGSYDYLSPQVFRVASTAVSLGSNAQWRPADWLVFQGHASGGIGYTSTGTVAGTSDREYNYGFAPEAMLSLRAAVGDRLLFDGTTREFFNGRLTRPETGGTDRVVRTEASLTYRLYRNHAVALKFISSRRNFSFAAATPGNQRRDSLGLYYVYEAAKGFGAVEW